MRVRAATTEPETLPFANNPWTHLRMDTRTGEFLEQENPYPTPESLYLLCEPDHVYEAFKGDFECQAIMAKQFVDDVDIEIIVDVAETLGVNPDTGTPEAIAATASEALRLCALRSTMYVIDRTREFASDEGKNLLLLLSYSSRDVIRACEGRSRFDREFVDYLESETIPFIDGLNAHVDEYQTFSGTAEEYASRYYISHYNPRGNHFFAFAIKDEIVKWLNPRPPNYSENDHSALEVLSSCRG